jgi:hypothetical protein
MHVINSKHIHSDVGPYSRPYMAVTYNGGKGELKTAYELSTINTHLVEFSSMFVGFDGSLGYGNTYYKYDYAGRFRYNVPGPYVGEVDEIIVLAHHGGLDNFGHMFQDILQSLFLIPDEIKNRSSILVNLMPIGIEVIDLMGFRKSQQVRLNRGEWIHAARVHTILNPSPFLNVYGDTVLKLRNLIRGKLELDKIEATEYFFSNRCNTCPRYIQNLDEIINATKKEYPNIQFKMIDEYLHSIYDAAKNWARAKFIFGPTGSNFAKSYFMKENSVIVSIVTKMGDFSILCLNGMNRIFILQCMTEGFGHWDKEGGVVNVSKTMKAIRAGFYCVENRKWPSGVISNI